jgi:5-methylcytosine-specific restriction endonuclease McrA
VAEPFIARAPSLEDYWRGIILFGRNVASYKFALGKSLLELKRPGGNLIKLEELAEPFSRQLAEHLKTADKQITSRSSKFIEACKQFNTGHLSKQRLIDQTIKLGFNNVIDAFHVVNQGEIPQRFFMDERAQNGGIRITDAFSRLMDSSQADSLPHEVESRWRLVETAWELGITRNAVYVAFDPSTESLFASPREHRRKTITSCRPALNGYQRGKCFYCDSALILDGPRLSTDVDHFFPHVLKGTGIGNPLDGVWNLVLTCTVCNRGDNGKFARLPTTRLLEKLSARNEYLISSHHPLQQTLILQTGADERARRYFLHTTYQAALNILIHTWEPS